MAINKDCLKRKGTSKQSAAVIDQLLTEAQQRL